MTYQYTGGTLSPSGSSGIPAVTNITAIFTADLAPNLSGSSVIGSITDWTISDGITTITQSSTGYALIAANASTDASASLTAIFFSAERFPFDPLTNPILLGDNYDMQFAFGSASRSQSSYCVEVNSSGLCNGVRSATSNAPGSLVSVPAPATLALFGLGVAGLGFSRRRKLH